MEKTEQVKKRVAVLRHADADGFGAAFSIWKALKDTCELLFIPVQYGQDVPWEALRDFGPDKVFIVDFSYKTHILEGIASIYPDLTVIDHHKSALPELQAWLPEQSVNPGAGSYFFDLERSGCGLTWDLFHLDPDWNPNEHGVDELQASLPMPEILLYVQDRDLWRFELENSKEINAYIATMPENFEEWDNFYLPEAYTAGKAVIAFQNAQIQKRLKDVRMMGFIIEASVPTQNYYFHTPCAMEEPYSLVPFVNASENVSELGEAMCSAYPDAPFSVSYCDRADGKRSYSLRSRNGFDVSTVAKAFQGGGHFSASGFTLAAPDII